MTTAPSTSAAPPSQSPAALVTDAQAPLTRALLVTALAAAVAPVLGHVPLPYVDLDGARELMFAAATVPSELSVGALGIAPWLSSLLLVELAALVVPRWRPLRHTALGRTQLSRVATVLGVLVAVVQAAMTLQWIAAVNMRDDALAPELAGAGPRLLLVATLVAGACLVRLAASFVDRHGVGNGIVVVLLGASAAHVLEGFAAMREIVAADALTAAQLALSLAGTIAVAIATARLARPLPDARVVIPTAGVLPASFAFSTATPILELVGYVAGLFNVLTPAALRTPLVPVVVVTAVSLPLLHALFASPGRAAVARARAAGRAMASEADLHTARVAAKAAFVPTLGLNALVVAAFFLSQGYAHFFSLMIVMLLVAGALDLHEEWRARQRADLVAVWPLASFVDVALAREALAAESIAVHMSGGRVRALSHVLAPWAAVQVLVPRADAARATAIVSALVARVHPAGAR